MPDGHTLESWLRAEVERGAAERYGDPLPPDARDRIDYELQVIDQLGFAGYFLIVADLCRHAREHGIRVGPGRGARPAPASPTACASPTSTRSPTG